MNKNQVIEICQAFDLGLPIANTVSVSGGLIHRMWRLDTSHGSFAIKELDAMIMQRPGIVEEYILSEKIAAKLQSQGISIATALLQNGTPLFETNGAIVMVFPWVNGKTLMLHEVRTLHAKQIGEILFKIHAADMCEFDLPIPEPYSILSERWHSLINEAVEEGLPWASTASIDLPMLIKWSDAAKDASLRLNKHLVIGHKDIDPKNVLWRDECSPVVIDWEGVGLINSSQDIINVAFEWAGMSDEVYNESIFAAVIDAYIKAGGILVKNDFKDALCGLVSGILGWLEFNMFRSLSSSGYGEDIQKLGIQETYLTLKKLHFLTKREGGL